MEGRPGTEGAEAATKDLTGPFFIVIEGADGVGKTTMTERLCAHLGEDVVRLREPTGQKWGTKIREMAAAGTRPRPGVELSWFMLDRMENVRWNILPALAAGKVVVQDRYFYSTAAYQGAYAGVDSAFIIDMHRAWAPEPDLLFIMNCDPHTAAGRVAERGRPDAFESVVFQEKVAEEFRVIAHRTHDDHPMVVTADTGRLNENDVFHLLLQSIQVAAQRKQKPDEPSA